MFFGLRRAVPITRAQRQKRMKKNFCFVLMLVKLLENLLETKQPPGGGMNPKNHFKEALNFDVQTFVTGSRTIR